MTRFVRLGPALHSFHVAQRQRACGDLVLPPVFDSGVEDLAVVSEAVEERILVRVGYPRQGLHWVHCQRESILAPS